MNRKERRDTEKYLIDTIASVMKCGKEEAKTRLSLAIASGIDPMEERQILDLFLRLPIPVMEKRVLLHKTVNEWCADSEKLSDYESKTGNKIKWVLTLYDPSNNIAMQAKEDMQKFIDYVAYKVLNLTPQMLFF